MSLRPSIYSLRKHGAVLATRGLGAEIAAALRAGDVSSDGLILDFKGVRVASSPCLDEIACALRSMIADNPPRFVLLGNMNEDLVDTMELVVERRDIVLTAVRDGKLQTVGGTRQLDETLAAAEELGTFTAPELAEQLELKLPNLHQRLNQLMSAGALTKADDPSAQRGRRLLFSAPEPESRALAGSC